MSSAVVANSDRAQFSREIGALNMKPLWERVMRLKPGTAAVPAIWRWEEVRPLAALHRRGRGRVHRDRRRARHDETG